MNLRWTERLSGCIGRRCGGSDPRQYTTWLDLNDRSSEETVGILGIDNRTENWRTAWALSPLVENHRARSSLVKRLVDPNEQCGESIEFELFWKGVRDYVHEHQDRSEAHAARFLALYRDRFPLLRQQVEGSGVFQSLKAHNYLAEDECKEKLYNNLRNTEVDIVLQTATHLCIGEAKLTQRFGANSTHVLVHQLIRQYVMAKILVELTGCKRKIVPFVVGDCREGLMKDGQVQFMIKAEYLHSRNVLSWSDLSKILATVENASCEPDLESRFNDLAEKWASETAHQSMMSSVVLHKSYQEIIGLGHDVLPLILRRLSTEPNHWFWALRAISGEDPVPADQAGKFDAMRQAWLRWGRGRGLVA